VLVLVEVTDIVFAVDSIPAIFAVTQEPFIVFTANAFAILGLRAMYFLLADLIHRFIYLKLGLSLVLVWVGVKMLLLVDIYKIPTTFSLAVVLTIIAISIGLSLYKTRGLEAPVPARAPGAPGTAQEPVATEDGDTTSVTAARDDATDTNDGAGIAGAEEGAAVGTTVATSVLDQPVPDTDPGTTTSKEAVR
jgi:tellurite resistance protein TerC